MTNEITSDFRTARPVSGERMSMFEIALPGGEFEYFHVVYSDNYLFVTDSYGSGIIAYMERDTWFPLDWNLQLFHELIVQKLESGEPIEGELF